MRIHYLLVFACIVLSAGCTSARKTSRYNLPPDPGLTLTDAAVEAAPSLLRQEASRLVLVGSCEAALVKRVRSLALSRWPKVGCPEKFSSLLSKFEAGYTSEEKSILRALERIDCQGQGLISFAEGTNSLADGLKEFISRKGLSESSSGRFTASAEGEAQLIQLLEQIMSRNVRREKRVAVDGEFVLPEQHLKSIVGLVQNGCRLKTIGNYKEQDGQMLSEMESNESLFLVPEQQREYASLREGLRRIFSQQIRSYF